MFGLITRRSRVRIPPPLCEKALQMEGFLVGAECVETPGGVQTGCNLRRKRGLVAAVEAHRNAGSRVHGRRTRPAYALLDAPPLAWEALRAAADGRCWHDRP